MSYEIMEGAEPAFTQGETAGVLLLHDLAGSPQAMRSLASAISEAGFTVDIPLLPGHGTAIDDLSETTWDDWAGTAQLALDELASRSGPVVAVGIGMGATLACWAAASYPDMAGVIAINPRVLPVPQSASETLQAMLADGMTVVPPLRHDVSDQRVRVVAYETVPISTLLSMFESVNAMADHWDELKCPILVVTSARDHRVDPANAAWLVKHAVGQVEELTLERSFHLATMDVEHEELEKAAIDFIARVTQG